MIYLLQSEASAQEMLIPLVVGGGECGPLCDIVEPLLWGTPILFSLLAFATVLGLHRTSVASQARAWAGNGVTWPSLWLLPLGAGILVMMAGAALLLALAFSNDDFRLVLFVDWRRPSIGLVWVVSSVLGVLSAPCIAAARSR
jgi:hypothetical protein